jgi:hypothetical protein
MVSSLPISRSGGTKLPEVPGRMSKYSHSERKTQCPWGRVQAIRAGEIYASGELTNCGRKPVERCKLGDLGRKWPWLSRQSIATTTALLLREP